MDAKPTGIARCVSKNKKSEGYLLSFKAGPGEKVGTFLLYMDEEQAEQFESGTEYKYAISFERIVHSESGG